MQFSASPSLPLGSDFFLNTRFTDIFSVYLALDMADQSFIVVHNSGCNLQCICDVRIY